MPIYEFKCEECGNEFEELVRGGQDNSIQCPQCRSTSTRRLISMFAAAGTSSPAGHGGSSCSTSGCSTKSCYT